MHGGYAMNVETPTLWGDCLPQEPAAFGPPIDLTDKI